LALNEGIEIKATGSVQLPHCHSFAKVASIGETIDGLMEGVSPLTGYSSSITEETHRAAELSPIRSMASAKSPRAHPNRNIVVRRNEYSDRVQRDGRRPDGRGQCGQFQ